MTQTQLDRAIEQCRSVGSNFIGMLGGEPLSEETVPLIDRAAGGNAQATLYVYTNGDHLARQGLGPLAQRHNIAYFVSTDGSTARTHDRLRNAGSFENVCGAFAVLRDAGKFRGAAVTLRGENYNDVTSEHFLEFLVDQGAQVAHIMKAKSLDPRRDMSEANFRNAIGRMKQSLRRVPLFTIFGGQGDGKGSSTDAFSYRELYMMLDGTVRISKAGFNRTYGNWEEEPLADIVGRIAADLLPTM
jgi:MoaA/NifB/PqqE/SkfB family radical SAM enzyme